MKIDYQLQLLRQAYSDIEHAKTWYNIKVIGLGDAFGNEINHSIRIIREFPLMFPITHRNQRKFVCSGFPFKIYFELKKKEYLIVIVGILHDKQDLKKLKGRK